MSSTPQHYIDALRKKDYTEALKLLDYVNLKYAAITGSKDLGQDDILPLVLYELCQTDVGIKDVESLHFFSEYIYHHNVASGKAGQNCMTLAQAFPCAVEMKKDPEFKQIRDSIDLEDKQDVEDFVNEKSDFSRLTAKITSREDQPLVALFGQQLSEQDLNQKIVQMNNEQLFSFHQSMERLKKEQYLDFECPLIEARISSVSHFKSQLEDAVNSYQAHLERKLESHGILVSTDGTPASIRNDDQFPQNLWKRYEQIRNLDIKNIDITDEQQIKKVEATMQECKDLRPSWEERSLLEKVTDVISFGIKPLVRYLTSRQNKIESEISDAIENVSLLKNSSP